MSPYVGLFGTVWGIMHAFIGLSNLQQVTLATVAPGIAEALVATAIGLFAAIPAVIAYNRFARDIDRIAIQLETFIEEFSNILQRNARRACRRRAAPTGADGARTMPAVISRGRGRRTINEINMVPFIDVMLVLLIIFMVTRAADHDRRGRPAEVGKAQQRADRTSIEVVVGTDEALRLRVDGKDAPPLAARTTSPRACATRRPASRRRRSSSRADRSVKYEAVVKVMDTLQRAGVQRVGLSVKSQRGG